MHIAVIGGSGFIGTVLTRELLAAGHDVKILDISPSKDHPDIYEYADITSPETLSGKLKDIDAIYLLAAAHRDDIFPRSIYYDVNVEGTKNIIAEAEKNNIKTIIFTSTVAVYGLDAGESKEKDTPAPFNDYGESKLQAENALKDWAEKTGARLVITRLVATFGPGNRGNVFTLIDQISKGRFLMIGSGKNAKSVAYVGNVARFLEHALKFSPTIHLYNYADKPDMTMLNMVKTIRGKFGMSGPGFKVPYIIGITGGVFLDFLSKITGKSFPISAIRVRKFCSNTIVCCDKLQTETDFVPSHTLSQGLQDMIESDFPQHKTGNAAKNIKDNPS